MNILTKLAIVSGIAVISASSLYAQATRTWVSGVGDDANPCSRTAPCKTFAGAYSKTAAGGEIDALDPGGFGAVTITKAITIDGGAGTVGSILVAGTNAVIISAAPTDTVILRNLSIQGSGSGINGVLIAQAKAVFLDNVSIFNFTGSGVSVAASATTYITLNKVISQNNTTSGATFTTSSGVIHASVMDSEFSGNGAGLVAADNSKVTVRTSVATASTGAGFSASSTSAASTLDLFSCVSSDNIGAGALASGTSAVIRIGGSAFFSNASAFTPASGGAIYSYGDNDATGAGTLAGTLTKQ